MAGYLKILVSFYTKDDSKDEDILFRFENICK